MDRGNMAAAYRKVDTIIPRPDQLGIPEAVVQLYKKKRGLVLVTGPTGSGKSTTLASIINKANENLTDHIITLEDPIEYIHKHKKSVVNQREVGMDTLSYANALRAALREDPDIILVGEMRDLETISTAITAAETGHLVFSTLHTIGAASTIDRIIDVFPTHQQQQTRIQLAMILEGVISQALIPTADGHGRVAAFEVMLASPAIRSLIREQKNHQIQSTIQTSRAQGMITLDDYILDLYKSGTISRDMALVYAQDQVAMKKQM
jgi:twitching motility protein PilT